MRVKDKFFEKTKLVILILCFSQHLNAENIYDKIFNYNDELKNSSANFIQTNINHIQEGVIFFGDGRIKINYNNPEKLTIILSDKKGVYINHKLQESEFFVTKKSYIKNFFDIIHNKNHLEKISIEEVFDQILISEEAYLDNTLYTIRLIYENDPIKLRRLEIISSEEKVQMGFFNHNKENVFDKNFFSMIDPYLQ
jgi:outer membrane lipoprotein-sorting protein